MSVPLITYSYANSTKSCSGTDSPNHTILSIQTGIMNMRELCYSGLGPGDKPYILDDLSFRTSLVLSEEKRGILC